MIMKDFKKYKWRLQNKNYAIFVIYKRELVNVDFPQENAEDTIDSEEGLKETKRYKQQQNSGRTIQTHRTCHKTWD